MKNVSARPKKKVQTNEEVVWLFEYILQYITSPVFRDPIKDFIDHNCILFESNDSENSFDQTEIHNVNKFVIQQFKKLIEDLLDMMLIDLGASYEQFIEAARYGLESDGKKYFEQIIACDSYIYFKNLMVKRNLQLQSEAYELMYANATKQKEAAKKMVTQGKTLVTQTLTI